MTVLLFFISLLIPAFAQALSSHWQDRLQNRLLAPLGTLKSDFEIEKALLLFSNCLDKAQQSGNTFGSSINGTAGTIAGMVIPGVNNNGLSEASTTLNKQILGLILHHRERCRHFFVE